MRKLFIASLVFLMLTIATFAAVPLTPISSDGAVLVYENTFDDADAIADFTQYRDTWAVIDGKLHFTGENNSNTNSYIIYTGDSNITYLSDYIVEVDMFHSQGATGLVARADLDSVRDAGHGHCGYLTMISTNGYSGVMRTSTANGGSTTTFNTSKQLLHHDTNIHIRTAVRGDIVCTTLTDIDTGMTLWGWTQKDNSWSKGSVALFAYGKITNGLDPRNVAFDNLRIYTIPSLKESANFSIISGEFTQSGGAARLDSTSDNSVAIYKDTQGTGTVEADIFAPASGNVGLIFAKDGDSYYKLAYAPNNYLHLIKVANGAETLLKKTEYKLGTTNWGIGDLRAVYDGTTIYCYFLDKCLIKYTDNAPLSGTGVGVFADTSDNTILNFATSNVTVPDKADIIIWGHSHMGRWYHAHYVLGEYGKVMNVGIGGTSTAFWYTVANELTTYDADTVIIMSGSNDLSLRENTETLKYLSGTIDIMKAANPALRVILITEWYQPGRYEQYGEKVVDLNRLWAEYAEENSSFVTLVDGFGIGINKDGSINSEAFADTQHLSIISYDELNARVLDALKMVYTYGSGDADGDGALTLKDIMIALEMIVDRNISKLNELDMNSDEKISLVDILIMIKKIAK